MKSRTTIAKPSSDHMLDLLQDCHLEIRAQLKKLTALVSRLQARTSDDVVRRETVELMAFFSGPARDHNYDEERHVFPTLIDCEDAEARQAAANLSEDHAWMEFCWLDIESQLSAVVAGSAYDLAALSAGVKAFDDVTRDHMALEESLLYPRLRARLTPSTLKAMGREMAARRAAQRHG